MIINSYNPPTLLFHVKYWDGEYKGTPGKDTKKHAHTHWHTDTVCLTDWGCTFDSTSCSLCNCPDLDACVYFHPVGSITGCNWIEIIEAHVPKRSLKMRLEVVGGLDLSLFTFAVLNKNNTPQILGKLLITQWHLIKSKGLPSIPWRADYYSLTLLIHLGHK